MNIYDNLEVKKSCILNGFGLFAKKNFKKGELIYEKNYYKFPREVVNILFSCNNKENNKLMMQKIWGDGDDFYITLNIDQYINHSDNPNCLHGIALIDISKGEEIFEDYSSFDNEEWFQILNKEMGIWSYK
jgi:hypothetical protein